MAADDEEARVRTELQFKAPPKAKPCLPRVLHSKQPNPVLRLALRRTEITGGNTLVTQ
jgi:hypothetical protein